MPMLPRRAKGLVAARCIRSAFVALAIGGSGCAEEIADPAPFIAARDGSAPVATCTLGIDVPTTVFAMRCGTTGCHTGSTPAGGLDLVSPGVARRLIGVPSSVCSNAVLASTSGSTGFLYDKLHGSPRCGSAMPLGGAPLMPAEIDCVRAWIESQARGGTMDGGTMDGGTIDDAGIDAPPEARATVRRVDGSAPGEHVRCS
jgi:hypothetical protein